MSQLSSSAPVTFNSELNVTVMSVDEVVAFERQIAASGTPLRELMERAGAAVAEYVIERTPAGAGVLILCGSGNNGGDGWVAARLLYQAGYTVSVLSTRDPQTVTAQPAADAIADALAVCDFRNGMVGFESAQVIIDCLLGTGFNGAEVTGVGADWIRAANASSALRVACDVPSGLSARTGRVAAPCFKADATITMLAIKRGMTSEIAYGVLGKVILEKLGF